jgi:hypothetical protein
VGAEGGSEAGAAALDMTRRFRPPWEVYEHTENFCIRDASGARRFAINHEDEPSRRMAMNRLTRDGARRIAINIAKLADLLRR